MTVRGLRTTCTIMIVAALGIIALNVAVNSPLIWISVPVNVFCIVVLVLFRRRLRGLE